MSFFVNFGVAIGRLEIWPADSAVDRADLVSDLVSDLVIVRNDGLLADRNVRKSKGTGLAGCLSLSDGRWSYGLDWFLPGRQVVFVRC